MSPCLLFDSPGLKISQKSSKKAGYEPPRLDHSGPQAKKITGQPQEPPEETLGNPGIRLGTPGYPKGGGGGEVPSQNLEGLGAESPPARLILSLTLRRRPPRGNLPRGAARGPKLFALDNSPWAQRAFDPGARGPRAWAQGKQGRVVSPPPPLAAGRINRLRALASQRGTKRITPGTPPGPH